MTVLSVPINPEHRESTVRIPSCFRLGSSFVADLSRYASRCMQSAFTSLLFLYSPTKMFQISAVNFSDIYIYCASFGSYFRLKTLGEKSIGDLFELQVKYWLYWTDANQT